MGEFHAKLATNLLHELNSALTARRAVLKEILGEDEAFGAYITQALNSGRFEVRSTSRNLARFSLADLPGCCGVAVSHYAEVLKDIRDKGLGTLILDVRMEGARKMGYGLMLATVLSDNVAELALLGKNGWVTRGEFRNPKTMKLITTLTANL